MQANVGTADGALRLVVGVALIIAGLVSTIWLAVVGAVLVITAVMKWCPPYALLGISTCSRK